VFRATQVRCAPTEADSVLVAKKKTLFDDNPVQVNELTFVVKSDLSQLNQSIAALQVMSQQMHPKKNKADQEGEHNRNVLLLLQGRLTSVGENFRDILEASQAAALFRWTPG